MRELRHFGEAGTCERASGREKKDEYNGSESQALL
jgi:hypothetical protein